MTIDCDREWFIITKALAVAIEVMKNQPINQSWSDLSDMETLFNDRIEDEFDRKMFLRSAQVSIYGKADKMTK
ncbi:hypothetical protein ACQVP2_31940 [Methylobacterium aquaticum]|uniref:hypothetical protein n=1 Tax=Methylobacterium aquaticum TaxID=270351 RepID=UPI003D171F0C